MTGKMPPMSKSRAKYCRSVLKFSRTYAELARLKSKASNGEALSEEELDDIGIYARILESDLAKVLECQRENGFRLGIDFLSDSSFDGFSLFKGELVGDLSFAYQIACPWFCDFLKGESDNNFLFEVAALIRALTDVDEKYSLRRRGA